MVQKLLLLTMITQSCNVYGYFQNHCKGDDISKLYEKFHLTPLKCFIVTYYGVTSHPSAISTKKVLQKLMTDEICLMLQLALVLQANGLVFSQSYARNFYMCIISSCKKWYKLASCIQLCIPLL